jgi:hypothetical protein
MDDVSYFANGKADATKVNNLWTANFTGAK